MVSVFKFCLGGSPDFAIRDEVIDPQPFKNLTEPQEPLQPLNFWSLNYNPDGVRRNLNPVCTAIFAQRAEPWSSS
jgi:hypothetical protein